MKDFEKDDLYEGEEDPQEYKDSIDITSMDEFRKMQHYV